MTRRIILLFVAIIMIGLYVLPSTLSLFTGMHTFKAAAEISNDEGCRKCHEDIHDQLNSEINAVHWNVPGPKGSNDVFQCTECHRVDLDISAYYQKNSTTYVKGHAATTVPCLSCHSKLAGLKPGGLICNSCHLGIAPNESNPKLPGTDQFPMHALAYKYGVGHDSRKGKWCTQCHRGKNGKVFIENIDSQFNGNESHRYFYMASKYPDNQTTIRSKGSNAACIACHTNIKINISWRRSIGYIMTASATNNGAKLTLTNVSPIFNTSSTSG